jgi:hypothetical protein
MCIMIPPKLAVSEVIGYLKGKGAISVARQFGDKQWNLNEEKNGPEDMQYQQLVLNWRRSRNTLPIRKKWMAIGMKEGFNGRL